MVMEKATAFAASAERRRSPPRGGRRREIAAAALQALRQPDPLERAQAPALSRPPAPGGGVTTVRPIASSDEAAWRGLWRGYLDFYGTELPEEVYAASFARLIDPAVTDYHGLLAFVGETAAGLAHYIFHRHGWQIEDVTYLQDLYVAPEARGTGAGRALIEAVYAAADAAGRPNVYWLTEDGNTAARRLYDRVGTADALRQVPPLRPPAMRRACSPASRSPALAACAAPPARPARSPACASPPASLPRGVARSNADLARGLPRADLRARERRDARRPAALRGAGPGLSRSAELAPYRDDLTALLARLRAEAGIDIAETGDPAAAQIRIEAVPAAQISRVFPTAACFIVPGETDWRASCAAARTSAHPLVRRRRRSSGRRSSCRSTPPRRTCATA